LGAETVPQAPAEPTEAQQVELPQDLRDYLTGTGARARERQTGQSLKNIVVDYASNGGEPPPPPLTERLRHKAYQLLGEMFSPGGEDSAAFFLVLRT